MASTPSIRSHDLTLGDGTTTLGLRLALDKSGQPQFQIAYAPSLSPQQFENLSAAAFPPQYQAYEVQEDWSAGFGKQLQSLKRYMQSFGVDASFKNLLMPGPVPVASTKTTPDAYSLLTVITNGGFETGDLTAWSNTTGWSVVTTDPRTGTKHAKRTGTGAIENVLSGGDMPLYGSGITIAVSAYGKSVTDTPTLTVILKDTAGNTLATGSGATLNTAGYTQATVSHLVADGDVSFTVRCAITGGSGGDVYLDDVTITISGTIATALDMGTVKGLVDFNNAHYAYSETGLWKRTNANWVRVANSPDNILDAVTDGTDLYLARGTSATTAPTINYWYMNTSEVFSRNTGTGNSSQVNRFTLVGGLIYGARQKQTVYKYNALASGGTSASYTVGQSINNITDLVNHLETVYVAKENGLFYINTAGTVVEVVPEMRSVNNANTGKNSISWWGNLYVPAGTQTLFEYDAGDILSLGPASYAERLSNFGGQIVATTSDEEWLYVVIDDGANIQILKGRRQTISDITPATDFRWHPFVQDTYATVAYAQVTSIAAGLAAGTRLWYGGGTALPKYIPLPTQYADPLTGSGLSWQTGVTWESSWLTFGLANVNKTLMSVSLLSTGLTTAKTVTVEYKKLGDASWTELGGSGNGVFTTSPSQEKFFASGVSTKQVKLRLTFTSDNTTVAFGITSIIVYAVTNPARLAAITATVIVGDENVTLALNIDPEMIYSKVASQLHAWTDTHPLTLIIPDGTVDGVTYTVKFAEGYPRERFLDTGAFEPSRPPRSLFDLAFVETRTS